MHFSENLLAPLCARARMVPGESDPGIHESPRAVKGTPQTWKSDSGSSLCSATSQMWWTRAPISYSLQQAIWPHWTSASVPSVPIEASLHNKESPPSKKTREKASPTGRVTHTATYMLFHASVLKRGFWYSSASKVTAFKQCYTCTPSEYQRVQKRPKYTSIYYKVKMAFQIQEENTDFSVTGV